MLSLEIIISSNLNKVDHGRIEPNNGLNELEWFVSLIHLLWTTGVKRSVALPPLTSFTVALSPRREMDIKCYVYFYSEPGKIFFSFLVLVGDATP